MHVGWNSSAFIIMGPHMWKKPWSRLFKGKAIEVDSSPSLPYQEHSTLEETALEETNLEGTPELYFNLTRRCMEQVDRVCPAQGSSLPKFNQEQCNYLAIKLKLAIQRASSIIDEINTKFLSLVELEHMAQLLGIFKLLYAMGVEVEDLIQSCCKESWIQSAIMLTSMSKLIALVGFNLEVCTIVFSTRYMKRKVSLSHFEYARICQTEVEVVKEKADLDEAKLIMDMKNVIESNPSSSPNYQLAAFLLRRLEMATLHPSSSKGRFENQTLPPLMSSLKQMLDCLGRGAFGSVYKAMWLGVEVAKKTFYGPSTSDFLREMSILDGLNHPNIVSLLWYMSDEKRCHLIMELMDGDLLSLMEERRGENGDEGSPFNIQEALDLILQIGEGMLYLHEKRIVHRDLKSRNILTRGGKMAKGNVKYLHVKVADFGLSRTKEYSATYSDLTLNVGTTRWMAPEMMRVGNVQSDDVDEEREAALKYPFKIDIYSFAMVCYEILTGDVPFSSLSHSEVKKAVLSGDRPPLPRACPYRLRTLIEACWSVEASIRPSFGNICEELRDLKYANLQIYWKANYLQTGSALKDIGTIDELVARLSSPVVEVQRSAAYDIHVQAMKSFDHRIYIKEQGAMSFLILLHYSRDLKTREHAITALQALLVDDDISVSRRNSLNDLSLRRNLYFGHSSSRREDYLGSAVGPIVEVLKIGHMKACENAAEALVKLSFDLGVDIFSPVSSLRYLLSAMSALVTLLEDGSVETKEYAAILLFKACHPLENYAFAIQVGIVPPLMNLIAQHSDSTMLENAFGILVFLTKDREGLIAIAAVRPTPILVKFIPSKSQWNEDRTILILLKLCVHDPQFIKEARESTVVESLTNFVQHPPASSFCKQSARALLQLLQELMVDDQQL